MAAARRASGAPWWKPPGLADVSDLSDAQLLRLDGSSSSSAPAAPRHASKLVERALAYVAAPTSDALAALYQLTRRATTQTAAFPAQHAALALRTLDVLAEHALLLAKPAATADAGAAAKLTGVKAAELQQLLDLVYLLCKGTAIGYPSHALGKLLQWLTASVVAAVLNGAPENETLLKLQLVVVAEMLKSNAGVRIYVKEMKKIKEFYRSLTILLNSTEDAEFLLPSMAILARLVLNESLGAKLFSPKNVDQALELIFSVLEDTWDSGASSSSSSAPGRLSDLLRHTPWLQCSSVDLLCDLTERSEILSSLETQPRIEELMDTLVGHIHLNGNAQHLQVAIYFLSAAVGLGHQFRKLLIKIVTDHDVFHRMLQVTLHPSRLIGMLTTELLLKIIGDNFRPFRGMFESSLQAQQLSPVVNGLFRLINEASAVVQQSETVDEIASSEEYLLSVHVCQLLTKLAAFPVIRKLCVGAFNLNQSASVIQAESAQVLSVDSQHYSQFHPRLSIQLAMLLSSLIQEPTMEDSHRRTLSQFLQSSDVATILGAALFSRDDKDIVVETLLLFSQFIAQSSNKRFIALSFAEGIISVGQRFGETTDNLHSTIASMESNVEAHSKTIERLQAEVKQSLRAQDDAKSRHDQEILELKSKFMDQLKQKDEAQTKARELYESKLREVNAQCESLAQVMNKKMGSLHHREQLLQENRAKRIVLEDENNELKRKVHVLEVRLEEIAQAHSITLEEMKIRDKEVKNLQDELTALSSDYTGQREEIERAQDAIKKLEDDLQDRSDSQESTFKELVLLSKAHKALMEEKDALMKEMDSMRDELSNLESLNVSIQSRLQEKKDMMEQLERKTKRLEESTTIAQNALEDERDKRRSVVRDLDDLRKAHRKLESEAAMTEIRAAETHLLIESKEEHIRKCEEEIRHLSCELKKHSKVQALIHQLSSGGDPQAVAASAFLARDS